jgi:hypothetical protein
LDESHGESLHDLNPLYRFDYGRSSYTTSRDNPLRNQLFYSSQESLQSLLILEAYIPSPCREIVTEYADLQPTIGRAIDCLDSTNQWRSAVILEFHAGRGVVRVKYDHWPASYSDFIPFLSNRLAPHNSHATESHYDKNCEIDPEQLFATDSIYWNCLFYSPQEYFQFQQLLTSAFDEKASSIIAAYTGFEPSEGCAVLVMDGNNWQSAAVNRLSADKNQVYVDNHYPTDSEQYFGMWTARNSPCLAPLSCSTTPYATNLSVGDQSRDSASPNWNKLFYSPRENQQLKKLLSDIILSDLASILVSYTGFSPAVGQLLDCRYASDKWLCSKIVSVSNESNEIAQITVSGYGYSRQKEEFLFDSTRLSEIKSRGLDLFSGEKILQRYNADYDGSVDQIVELASYENNTQEIQKVAKHVIGENWNCNSLPLRPSASPYWNEVFFPPQEYQQLIRLVKEYFGDDEISDLVCSYTGFEPRVGQLVDCHNLRRTKWVSSNIKAIRRGNTILIHFNSYEDSNDIHLPLDSYLLAPYNSWNAAHHLEKLQQQFAQLDFCGNFNAPDPAWAEAAPAAPQLMKNYPLPLHQQDTDQLDPDFSTFAQTQLPQTQFNFADSKSSIEPSDNPFILSGAQNNSPESQSFASMSMSNSEAFQLTKPFEFNAIPEANQPTALMSGPNSFSFSSSTPSINSLIMSSAPLGSDSNFSFHSQFSEPFQFNFPDWSTATAANATPIDPIEFLNNDQASNNQLNDVSNPFSLIVEPANPFNFP